MEKRTDNEFLIRYFSTVSTRTVDWLWYPYITFGKITIIQGNPGDGKTTLVLNIAALLSNGMSMPESVQSLICANIIYQSAEDSAEDTLKPRLVIIGHMNKASGSKGVYRGLDSIDITADELLGGDAPQNDVSKPSEAVDKLAKMLCGGAAPCGQIYAALLEAGISKRSVDRTKKQLNVKSMKRADCWYWALQEVRDEKD